jgi:arylsulfatase A-like enzyme
VSVPRVTACAAAAGLLASACGSPAAPPRPLERPRARELAPSAQARASASRRRPNIVFVLTDDLDSGSLELMPKTLALVGSPGATFLNSFAATPLCCPSRASLLTGQYAHNHGILTNGGGARSCFEDFRDRGSERAALPSWLKAAGYRTGFVGKYLNRYPGADAAANDGYVPPGWDDWHATFVPRGSENCPSCAYYDYAINDNGEVERHGRREADYITDVETERALGFIRGARAAGGDAPFFLWLAYTAPHSPSIPAPRHQGGYADKRAPRTAAFNEDDIDDKPNWFRSQPKLSAADIADLDGVYRSRLESLMAVDDAVESIVDALATIGELQDTYIFFTSDNGFLLGQHRFPGGKAAVYEESIRVPLLVRGPGVTAGRRPVEAALNIDLAATFAEIAAATPTDFVDGRSLVPLFSGAAPAWRKDLLVEFEAANVEGLPSWAGLRDAESIFVDYPAVAEREYYDLVRDPEQLENRYRSLDSARATSLVTRLNQLLDCRGASCRQ